MIILSANNVVGDLFQDLYFSLSLSFFFVSPPRKFSENLQELFILYFLSEDGQVWLIISKFSQVHIFPCVLS